jgi:hypothetical protein
VLIALNCQHEKNNCRVLDNPFHLGNVVTDHAFSSSDKGMVTLLVLLDLSAAFDTVDHCILLKSLSYIGVRDSALNWFKHYLSGRTCSVKCGESLSSKVTIEVGVPQGSVLGPILFTIYLHAIGSIIQKHDVQYVIYADDIQLFTHVTASNISSAINRLQACINDLQSWLKLIQLKMNPGKTEFIILGRKPLIKKVYSPSPPKLAIGNMEIPAKSSVRDLGFIIDSSLTMGPQINISCRDAFYYLRNISRQRAFLTRHATAMLVDSFVFSRIYYCSSLFYCLNNENKKKLNRVINYAARLVGLLKVHESTSSVVKKECWLPVSDQIELRIASLAFDILRCGKPVLLRRMLEYENDGTRTALNTRRTNDLTLLKRPNTKTKFGENSFRHAVAVIWNTIPSEIRSIQQSHVFRSKLFQFLLQRNAT